MSVRSQIMWSLQRSMIVIIHLTVKSVPPDGGDGSRSASAMWINKGGKALVLAEVTYGWANSNQSNTIVSLPQSRIRTTGRTMSLKVLQICVMILLHKCRKWTETYLSARGQIMQSSQRSVIVTFQVAMKNGSSDNRGCPHFSSASGLTWAARRWCLINFWLTVHELTYYYMTSGCLYVW